MFTFEASNPLNCKAKMYLSILAWATAGRHSYSRVQKKLSWTQTVAIIVCFNSLEHNVLQYPDVRLSIIIALLVVLFALSEVWSLKHIAHSLIATLYSSKNIFRWGKMLNKLKMFQLHFFSRIAAADQQYLHMMIM